MSRLNSNTLRMVSLLLVLASMCGIATLISVKSRSAADSPSNSTIHQRDYWPTMGWRSSTPEEQGMDAGAFSRLDQYVKERAPQVYSVLVVRHGYMVFEKYYRGDADLTYEVASATKSFTSALVGIALQQGYLKSLDQKVIDFFPEYATPDLDPRTTAITIKNLLTMTSGFDWSEESPWSWPQGGDWIKYILDTPMSSVPGRKFTYDTPAVHLLSAVLTRNASMSTLDFADRYLFKPLGIATPQWQADPQGRNNGGRGLFLRAPDLAKFGYLYLNDGLWDGTQIVPVNWVRESTQKQSEGGFPEHESYGYLWWVTTTQGHAAYFAAGYGGQYIDVVPDLDLVVVITSNLDQAHLENRKIVDQFVLPAIKN